MRILVCGGREFNSWIEVSATLDACVDAYGKPEAIICGGARGADTVAENWAKDRDIDRMVFPADWQTHGAAAGPIRNQRMLDEGKPDLVVAFPGGRGTADMVRRAQAAGVCVVEVKVKA